MALYFDAEALSNWETMKILIVDGSIFIRRSMIKLIISISEDIEIAEAVNAPEGVRMVNDFKPDVLVVDVTIPGGTGFGVIVAAKKSANPPTSIVFSKYSDKKYREEATKVGADHFLDKSTEFNKIIETIKHIQRDMNKGDQNYA